MTEAEIRAYVIADNKLAENAGWDRNLLALELQHLSDLGLDDLDVTITGFELPEIEVLMGELATTDSDGSADEVIEPTPGPAITRVGDVWRIGDHRLVCGDSGSQSMGELDRVLERREKFEARLKGTRARGPARGRRRKQAEERLEEIERALSFVESGLVRRHQDKRAHARERRRRSSQRLEAARAAMTQRIDTQAEWVITTFRSLVDGLKAGTISPVPSPIPPPTASSNPDPQVDIGILQRMGLVQPGKMLGGQLGWSEAWIPEPKRRLFFIIGLRDRKRPCAVFVVCDPERQAHQMFALKRTKGRFGRQEYRFICPNTARQSTTISYLNGQFFCSN
jgi:hypothetical protein